MGDNMSYEFKLFLDHKLMLREDRKPIDQVAGLSFLLKDNMQIHLLDTPELRFYEVGWIVRSRLKDGKRELTYKRRFRDYSSLDSAISQAGKEGFTPADYEYEVEWGYKKQALSLSRDFNLELEGQAQEQWKQLMLDKAPQPFKDSGAFKSAEQARVMGAVQSAKYKSEWNQDKVSLEVWTIGEESMAEVTMKMKNATEAGAADKHRQFIALFQESNLLLEKDMSKTKWALEKLKQSHAPQTVH
ncbi:hypothetical protein R70723_23375 [Paenibacillus sp. FSL R7-0273]|uniref:hypothetical protein n=1 Tax=Paenibacillus sp. FSL R7-0273 TaxID=1536772 RepID=UPI0004F89546|nr:hypothetical protein [Paenibacillus sp. FSL R7-0273]AIQ48528.1 hypothetical protein R70723_23375 [Paenibacillus sp. FSL R7-0273]OMF87616.1 hypothetical protein BK144_23740 [Paenibacillus sp. FSL R7-0273]